MRSVVFSYRLLSVIFSIMRLSHWFVISCSFGAGVVCAFGVAAVFPLSPKVATRPVMNSGNVSPAAVKDDKVVPADTFVPVKVRDTVVEETGMEYPVLASENEKYGRNVTNDIATDVPTDKGDGGIDKGDGVAKTERPNILYFGVDHYPLSPTTLRMLEQHKMKTIAIRVERHWNDHWSSTDIRLTDSLSDSPLARVQQYQTPRPMDLAMDRMIPDIVPDNTTKKGTAVMVSPPPASASYFRKR